MPVTLNPLEQFVMLTMNQAPGPMVEVWSGLANRIIVAGIRLNVFETLQQEPAAASELAQRLNLDARGMNMLLETLTALGYLEGSDARFRITAMTRKWLTDAEGANVAPFLLFWGASLEQLFPTLEETFRTGKPRTDIYAWLETQPDAARNFQKGLAALARVFNDGVVSNIPVPARPCRLLDLGGGHAIYSIGLCQKYPQLSAVIFDSAQALEVGRESIDAAQLSARITVQPGDFVTDALGSGFDLVLLFNILHGFQAEQNIALLTKVRAALNPGGRIVIGDQLVGEGGIPIANLATRLFGIAFYQLAGGQAYTYDELRDILTQAGFGEIQLKRSLRAGGALIFAENPSHSE